MTDSSGTNTSFEVLRADFPRDGFRVAVFDFDGTISLIRRNWPAVMIPMMADVILEETKTTETREQLLQDVEEFVMRLNGKQTIFQMIQLTEEIKQRGGKPREPLEYKDQYHDLLWAQMQHRVEGLEDGSIDPLDLTVPGSHRLLEQLTDRGVMLCLASGTDLKYVRDEAKSLDVSRFFGEHIYAALESLKDFSKKMIIEKMIDELGVTGSQILGFGDGFVEIEEVRRVGGVAIGVASNEETCVGINDWKRQRLIRAGADVIIGDYRQQDELLSYLGL